MVTTLLHELSPLSPTITHILILFMKKLRLKTLLASQESWVAKIQFKKLKESLKKQYTKIGMMNIYDKFYIFPMLEDYSLEAQIECPLS